VVDAAVMRFRACESRSGFGRVRIRGVFVGLRGCGGSGLEGDGETEIFELRDQTTRASLGVLSVGEVVLAEVLVHLAGTEQVPDEFDQRVRDGDGRLVVERSSNPAWWCSRASGSGGGVRNKK
jgi:hypothetical protein